MPKKKLLFGWQSFCALGMVFLPNVVASSASNIISAKQVLLDRVVSGEVNFKDDLVQESIERLELIDPNDPEVIAAHFRLALRQNQQNFARQLLQRLKEKVPHSSLYRHAEILMQLYQTVGRQKLKWARMMAIGGHAKEAFCLYEELFHQDPPTIQLSVEYWTTAAKIPNQKTAAFQHLKASYNYLDQHRLLQKNTQMLTWQTPLLTTLSRLSIEQGDAYLKAGQLAAADQAYRQGEMFNPRNEEAFIGLGDLALVQMKLNQAEKYYQHALTLEPESSQAVYGLIGVYKRQSIHKALVYLNQLPAALKPKFEEVKNRLTIQLYKHQAEAFLEQKQWAKAIKTYQKAYQLGLNDIWLTYHLAYALYQTGQHQQADALFRPIVKKQANHPEQVYTYALYLSGTQRDQQALLHLRSLPRTRWTPDISNLWRRLQSAVYQKQAAVFAKRSQWELAAAQYQLAYYLEPNDVWLNYHLASAFSQLGQQQKAIRLFYDLAQKQPNDPGQIYVHALFLSLHDQKQQALTILNRLARRRWTPDIYKLSDTIRWDLVFEHAENLRKMGQIRAANAYLLKQPKIARVWLKLGDWALEDEQYQTAIGYYWHVLRKMPQDFDARMGAIEALIAIKRLPSAQNMLYSTHFTQPLNINSQRRIANAWDAVGESARAETLFARIKQQAFKEMGDSSALVFRDAARVEQKLNHPVQALADYAQAMVKSRISKALPQNNAELTYLTRNHAQDDWLKRSIRSDTADLYRSKMRKATLEKDFWSLKGTPGVSDYKADDTILELNVPWSDGRLVVRGDWVKLNAGRFTTENGTYDDNFGTCSLQDCSRDFLQKTEGLGVGAGFSNRKWAASLGTTPVGFPVVNWTGNLSYSSNFNHIGWMLSALRYPMTNSLLSFSGTKDPNTRIVWGGVVNNGLNLALSYDRGKSYGIWANIDYGVLTGRNVLTNRRTRLMEGYYYKFINEDNRRFAVGLTNMIWHYQYNLNGYSLGQGGYYSPQHYLSFSVPINYRARTSNWSYELGGSVSWSKSATSSILTFPLPSLAPSIITDNPIEDGGPGTAWGYTLLAAVERRLNTHFSLGSVIDIQRTQDYTPSHISLYLRYLVEGWQGDLDMPIRPVIPYGIYN